MVRVAGLKAQVREGIAERSPDGLTPAEQLVRINEAVVELASDQQAHLARAARELLPRPASLLVDGHDVVEGRAHLARGLLPPATSSRC